MQRKEEKIKYFDENYLNITIQIIISIATDSVELLFRYPDENNKLYRQSMHNNNKQ